MRPVQVAPRRVPVLQYKKVLQDHHRQVPQQLADEVLAPRRLDAKVLRAPVHGGRLRSLDVDQRLPEASEQLKAELKELSLELPVEVDPP